MPGTPILSIMQPETQAKKYVIPRPRNLYNFTVALFVAFGSLSYGYASSISAATIGTPAWVCTIAGSILKRD